MRPKAITVVLVFFGGSDCARRSSIEEELPQTVQEEGMEITIQPIVTEAVSGVTTRRRLVIREDEEWVAFWGEVVSRRTPRPEAPSLDFDRHMVIAASMGTRPTGGYSISIDDVSRRQGRLVVTVSEMCPGPGCVTIQALTSPVIAVRIPRSDDPVTFIERNESYDCGRGP
jgi:hypothetical protein